MYKWMKQYKNIILKALKIILLVFMLIFLILHANFLLLVRNWGYTFFINFVILITFIMQIRHIIQLKKIYQKIITSVLLVIVILYILHILLFDFLALILTKPVFVIDSYKISNNRYLKTVSWDTWYEDKNVQANTVEVQYEQHFTLGIYCYTPIQANSETDPNNFVIPKHNTSYLKKKLNLKKIYAKLDKKPSFCGKNLGDKEKHPNDDKH